ncbi:MAG: alpha/beta hydrolase [Elusimicrobiota bacterium]
MSFRPRELRLLAACAALLISEAPPSSAQLATVPSLGGTSYAGGAAPAFSMQAPALSPALTLAAPLLAASLPAAPAPLAAVPAAAVIPAASVRSLPAPAGPEHTLTGDVRFIQNFRSEALGNSRTVAVYLPPGYDSSNERYPVLYAHDGQNLFDAATAFDGREWGLDETAERMIRSGELPPFIIVAPYNRGDERIDEMTWVADPQDGGGKKGELYADFIVKELRPYIDANLRTLPGEPRLLGSSLGANMNLHIARTRPGIFTAGIGAMSSSIGWADREITKRYAWDPLPEPRPRIWLDMGTKEGDPRRPERFSVRVEEVQELGAVLRARGWHDGEDLSVRVIEGAEHNEYWWSLRAAEVLKFLFPVAPRL